MIYLKIVGGSPNTVEWANEGARKWGERFLQLAEHVARGSKDPSTKAGAVIVRPDKTVASMGYNGFPRGIADTPERLNDRQLKYKLTVHAEMNAILHAKESLKGYTMFIWPFLACGPCAAHIIQTGIHAVISPQSPPDKEERWAESFKQARDLFTEAGIVFWEVPQQERPFNPDWRVAPGEQITKRLNEMGKTQRWLKDELGMSVSLYMQLHDGSLVIEEWIAEQLGELLGGSAKYWVNLSKNFREPQERKDPVREFVEQLASSDVTADSIDEAAVDLHDCYNKARELVGDKRWSHYATFENVSLFKDEMHRRAQGVRKPKAMDYNRQEATEEGGDSLANLRRARALGIVDTDEQAILVRIADKIARLVSLTRDPSVEAAVKDESVIDTGVDAHNYIDSLVFEWLASTGKLQKFLDQAAKKEVIPGRQKAALKLYERIRHGDEKHRKWLWDEVHKFFLVDPAPVFPDVDPPEHHPV